MDGQGELPDLIRILTARRIPVLAAMGHVKKLQAEGLRGIGDIAKAPLDRLEAALGDAKLAKGLQAACKSHGDKAKKRGMPEVGLSSIKKPRLEASGRRDGGEGIVMRADELEESLRLPEAIEVEEILTNTSLVTNRAPLLLAFALELLRFTMPEQPLSSRLSLAQAVVDANSRAKAVSIGLEKAATATTTGAGMAEGQPRVRIMGRYVAVLGRGGYEWPAEGDEEVASRATATAAATTAMATTTTTTTRASQDETSSSTWTASQMRTSRSSSFVAHAARLRSATGRAGLMQALMREKAELGTATHNAWAMRWSGGGPWPVREASFDDGEQGCGALMLKLMREAGAEDRLVVLTRWYGGVMLGPDRWRLIRECVQEALSSQGRRSQLSGEPVWALDGGGGEEAGWARTEMPIYRPEGARNYLLRSFGTAAAAKEAEEEKEEETGVGGGGSKDGGGGGGGGRGGKSRRGGGRGSGKQTAAEAAAEREENLGRLLGALRLLFASWAGVLGRDELDRRAWGWYLEVRPEVAAGPSGWGAKGRLDLGRILELRRGKGVL